MPESPPLAAFVQASLTNGPYIMDAARRAAVLKAIVESCEYRAWALLAGHVRTAHVHVVVDAHAVPEFAMNTFKSYATRILRGSGLETRDRRIWARHGSTRYLWT